jgi:hypothetical protein
LAQKWPLALAIILVASFLLVKGYLILKAWFGLRKQTLDIKKADLEITKLESESRAVKIATFDEVTTYDDKTRRIIESARTDSYASRQRPGPFQHHAHFNLTGVILFLAALLLALYFFYK